MQRLTSRNLRKRFKFVIIVLVFICLLPGSLFEGNMIAFAQEEETGEELFNQILTRVQAGQQHLPENSRVTEIITSIVNGQPITISDQVGDISITKTIRTTVVPWQPEGGGDPTGQYHWRTKWSKAGNEVTVTCDNVVMIDPDGATKEANRVGELDNEGLVQHELLHGQLQINEMKTQGWQQNLINRINDPDIPDNEKVDLTARDNGHNIIGSRAGGLENDYLTTVGSTRGLVVRVIPISVDADANGVFLSVTVTLTQEELEGKPEGLKREGVNITEERIGPGTTLVNFLIDDGSIILDGRLPEGVTETTLVVCIDPPDTAVIAEITIRRSSPQVLVPIFPNWWALIGAAAAAGGLGYLIWRRRLAHEQA